MKAGPEFRNREGNYFIIYNALYELKSAGALFRSFLSTKINTMGFTSCLADLDVWRRPATKENGNKYYEYMMTYVNDIIAISKNARSLIEELGETGETLKFKDGKIEQPDIYLDAKLKKKVMDGVKR